MAVRPFFFVSNIGKVQCKDVEFEWFPGFSMAQKKRCVSSMHEKIRKLGYAPLEISTKSSLPLGVKLSAFSLKLEGVYLENVFQSSKMFENGGPYLDLLEISPKEAKRDERLRTSGKLIGFYYKGKVWKLTPATAFYDWIYIQAVKESLCSDELKRLKEYSAFTDIEFNPQKSINTQARSVALLQTLLTIDGIIPKWDERNFLEYHKKIMTYSK